MVAQQVTLVNSELRGRINEASVVLEPEDRTRGSGISMSLDEAISFARMVLEVEAMLAEETVGGDAAHPLA